jgi:hypothetical protein
MNTYRSFNIDETQNLLHNLFSEPSGEFKELLPNLIGQSYEVLRESFLFCAKQNYPTPSHELQAIYKNIGKIGFIGAGTVPITPFYEILRAVLFSAKIECLFSSAYSSGFYEYFHERLPESYKKHIKFSSSLKEDCTGLESFIESCDLLVCHGSDETVVNLQKIALNKKIKFLGYGHKLSFAVSEVSQLDCAGIIKDLTAFNQLGCMSPQVLYLMGTSGDDLVKVAESLKNELIKNKIYLPPWLSYEKKLFSERNLIGKNNRLFGDSILVSPESEFEYSCGGRFLWLKPLGKLSDLPSLQKVSLNRVACIGSSLSQLENEELREMFAETRIIEIGKMQLPPLDYLQPPTHCSL